MPVTAIAPVITEPAWSNGVNAAAHSSDSRAGADIPRRPWLPRDTSALIPPRIRAICACSPSILGPSMASPADDR